MSKIRIGTRESRLALVQAELVSTWIRSAHPEVEIELVGITTMGDQVLDKKLDKIGGKGLFIKELEQALLIGSIDLAVHSAKDLPARLADGLCLAAVSDREDPRDALVSRIPGGWVNLPLHAVVGTSSARREMQLLALRPDLRIQLLRGNVMTRLEKLKRGEYDAIVLASAGLRRLGLDSQISSWFSSAEMIPAVGQGILALETRNDFDTTLLAGFHSEAAWECLRAERAAMVALDGDCSIPLGIHAHLAEGRLHLQGCFGGSGRMVRASLDGSLGEPERWGAALANRLRPQGAES